MSNSGIFSSIDWYTCIFDNCSFSEILDIFGVQYDVDILSALHSFYLNSKGYSFDASFNFGMINLKIDIRDFYSIYHTDDISVIDSAQLYECRFPHVRCDLSGSCIRWLRSLRGDGFDLSLDEFLILGFHLQDDQTYHVTRCDFAYDLIDYKPDFLTDLISECNRLDTGNGVVVSGCTRPMKYSIRSGDQSTLYIGSTRSHRMLRIYDKRREFIASCKSIDSCPYLTENGELPSSWIRIELQTRREIADFCLHELKGGLNVLRYIYDNYQFVERGTHNVSSVWLDLFDWDIIPSIIQNQNSAEYVDYDQRSRDYLLRSAFLSLMQYVDQFGFDGLQTLLCDELDRISKCDDLMSVYRYRALLNRLLQGRTLHNREIYHLHFRDHKIDYIDF